MERLANVAIVVLCAAVAFDIGYRHLASEPVQPARGASMPAPGRDYAVGETLDRIPDYTPEPGKRALLLVVKSTCGFCRSSMPSYRKLNDANRQAGESVRLVGVCLENPDSCRRFFDAQGVQADTILGVKPDTVRVLGTPTLLLVDDTGVIRSVWRGALTGNGEREVLESVTGE